MFAEKLRKNDTLCGYNLYVTAEERYIIKKGLELFIDYNPRKQKDKPDFKEKMNALEMLKAMKGDANE